MSAVRTLYDVETPQAVLASLQDAALMGVAESVCRRHGIKLDIVVGARYAADGKRGQLCRLPHVVRCRDELLVAIKTVRPFWSYRAIGMMIGMDHKAVEAACKRFADRVGVVVVAAGEVVGTMSTAPGEENASSAGEALVEAGTIAPANGELPGTSRPESGKNPATSSGVPSRALASRPRSESGSSISQLSVLKSNSDSESSCLQAGAREGSAIVHVADELSKPKSRRPPERPMPADWAPKPEHGALARERSVDIDAEAAAFRAHAEAHDRRCVRWDAAFRQWLLKAQAKPRSPARTLVQRDDDSKRLWKIPEGF